VTDCRGDDVSNPAIVVLDGELRPLTVTAAPGVRPVCGLRTGDVELVVDVTTTEYGEVPPVMMNWKVLAGTQLALAIAPGVAVNALGGGIGLPVPNWLVTVGELPGAMVSPFASVMP